MAVLGHQRAERYSAYKRKVSCSQCYFLQHEEVFAENIQNQSNGGCSLHESIYTAMILKRSQRRIMACPTLLTIFYCYACSQRAISDKCL